MNGKGGYIADSRYYRNRPSLYSAHSSSRHFRSEPRSSGCAASRTASIGMSSLTLRLMPWRKVTARPRPNALPFSTRGWRFYRGGEPGSGSEHAAAFLRCRRRSITMPPISIQERHNGFRGSQCFWSLCRTDLGDDGGGVACPDRTAPGGGPFWAAAPRLAPGAVRVRLLHDHPLVHRPYCRTLRYADVERGTEVGIRQAKRLERCPASRGERPRSCQATHPGRSNTY